MNDARYGIVHVIGPELGFTLPGCTLVCGDSHTSTYGAFGAISLWRWIKRMHLCDANLTSAQAKAYARTLSDNFQPDVSVKNIILGLIAEFSASGGVGYAIEYAGETALMGHVPAKPFAID